MKIKELVFIFNYIGRYDTYLIFFFVFVQFIDKSFFILFSNLHSNERCRKNMKKTTAIIMVGMFVLVGCGSAVIGEDDDPIGTNRAPNAPVLIEEKSDWEKESYTFVFYSEDPDGDEVFYDIEWKTVGETTIVSCGPDDPVELWDGPYASGEEVEQTHGFYQIGKYELTIRAKDSHDSVGPATTISLTYKSSLSQFPLLSKLMDKYPGILNILAKLF